MMQDIKIHIQITEPIGIYYCLSHAYYFAKRCLRMPWGREFLQESEQYISH